MHCKIIHAIDIASIGRRKESNGEGTLFSISTSTVILPRSHELHFLGNRHEDACQILSSHLIPFKLDVEEVVYAASLVPKKICWD